MEQDSVKQYLPAPCFGNTGMSPTRFLKTLRCVSFSRHPSRQGQRSGSQYRWTLVQDFVDAINDHGKRNVRLSEVICVDDSISRWYGKDAHWIYIGLPHYVAIDRKRGNGCEIHLTPTKKRRKTAEGILLPYAQQKHCNVCKTKTTNLVFSSCNGLDCVQNQICGSSAGRDCFARHVATMHDLDAFETSDEEKKFLLFCFKMLPPQLRRNCGITDTSQREVFPFFRFNTKCNNTSTWLAQ